MRRATHALLLQLASLFLISLIFSPFYSSTLSSCSSSSSSCSSTFLFLPFPLLLTVPLFLLLISPPPLILIFLNFLSLHSPFVPVSFRLLRFVFQRAYTLVHKYVYINVAIGLNCQNRSTMQRCYGYRTIRTSCKKNSQLSWSKSHWESFVMKLMQSSEEFI